MIQTTNDYPVATIAIERAVRLVSTARLRDPVLLALVDPTMLDDLAEIEGATSFRLTEQSHAASLFPSGRPHANQRYRIELDDGRTIEGVTNHQGHTELTQDMALKIARLTLLKA